MLLVAGILALLAATAVVLWAGAESLSLGLSQILVAGDDDLVVLEEEEDNPGQPLTALMHRGGVGPVAWVGERLIFRLVDRLEALPLWAGKLLWAVVSWLARLFVVMGSGLDWLFARPAGERNRRRLARRLLYEMVLAHRQR